MCGSETCWKSNHQFFAWPKGPLIILWCKKWINKALNRITGKDTLICFSPESFPLPFVTWRLQSFCLHSITKILISPLPNVCFTKSLVVMLYHNTEVLVHTVFYELTYNYQLLISTLKEEENTIVVISHVSFINFSIFQVTYLCKTKGLTTVHNTPLISKI